jgi:chitodextrinase
MAAPACLAALALAPAPARAQAADSVEVTWTAPGDDDRVGTASSYELRMALAPITEDSFESATPVAGLPAPAASGTRQRVTVRGLERGTTYYFAIRTSDDAGNWSPISNVLRWDWILDTAPPSAPSGLSAAREGESVRVTWSPNPEADLEGYTVYRATSASGPYLALNTTLVTGTEYVDAGLPEGAATVWYQVSASDVSGNESARSAASSVTLQTAPVASEAAIEPGYPNPSRASDPVRIPVTIQGAGNAVVDVLDSGGRRVRRIELSGLAPGRQEVVWDGRNDAGRVVAPGAYRAWLIAGGQRSSIRLVRVP